MENDNARRKTEKQLKKMEREIREIYKKAAIEITKEWNEYMSSAAKEIEDLQNEYEKAKASGDKDVTRRYGIKLSKAKRKVTLQDKRYKAMIKEVTRQLANINQTATAYINGEVPNIYALNYNEISTDAFNLGVDFSVVDAHTVKRLIADGEIKMPQKKIDIPKDIHWNTKQMNSAVLQGILQGESIPKIANRIYHIVGNNETSAIRNARTMVTSAECHGRLDSYHDLADRGVVQKKVWIATPDDRTRKSHLDLDGEEQDIDDEFSNGCMFPGDGNGPAEEVWNCRCSIRTHIIGFRREDGSISKINYRR